MYRTHVNNRKEMIMEKGLMIDFESADRITLLTLINQRKYLKKELKDLKNGKECRAHCRPRYIDTLFWRN